MSSPNILRITGAVLIILPFIILSFWTGFWGGKAFTLLVFSIALAILALIFPLLCSLLVMASGGFLVLMFSFFLILSIIGLADTLPWVYLVLLAFGIMVFAGGMFVYKSAEKPHWWKKAPQPSKKTRPKNHRLKALDWLYIGIAVITVATVLVLFATNSL